MKLAKKRMAKGGEASKKLKVSQIQKHVCKPANKTGGQCPKLTGQDKELLVKNDKLSSCSRSAEALPSCLFDKRKYFAETTNKTFTMEQESKQIPHPSAKIKLQLFPLDEGTRMGLEKDGYHPYLELTLSTRKKISSVLEHLTCKWAGSSIATGEPILFPYILSEDLARYRWTLNDNDLTAGDVYASIGSPSIFRLRYGWFSDPENQSSGMPSASTPFEAFLQPESMKKECNNNVENLCSEQKQLEPKGEDLKPAAISGAGANDAKMADKMPSSGLAEPLNEVKLHVGIAQPSLWDDSLNNISIGGLLSEASLQGSFSNCDNPKSDGSKSGLQPSQLISDSFDAFLMAQANYSQTPRLPPLGTTSSILDAEDTCHAFPFQNHSSFNNAVPKPFKHSNINEVNVQFSLSPGPFKESETDLSLCSRIYNDESSLGLSGIKWTDSLGPFDLGLSSTKKITNGDSLSISRIIS